MMTFLKGRTFIVLIVLLIFFSITANNFLTVGSLLTVAKHVALYGILAIGMTYVIITGGIDLSVGSVAGLAGMIAGGLITEKEDVIAALSVGAIAVSSTNQDVWKL